MSDRFPKRAVLVGSAFVGRKKSRLNSDLQRSTLDLQSADLKVGVDGGIRFWLEWGILPDFAVGDWDSLRGAKHLLKKIPHLSLSENKDRSDLFFAARTALVLGATELLCLGVTGGPRMDHHLASLYDLSELSTGKYGRLDQVQAKGEDGDYFFLSEAIPEWQGHLTRYQTLSLFALQGSVQGATSYGLKYPLKNAILYPSSHGLSNQVNRRSCGVQIRKGKLVIIIPRTK